jgi:hypothetical protein
MGTSKSPETWGLKIHQPIASLSIKQASGHLRRQFQNSKENKPGKEKVSSSQTFLS